MKLCKLSKNVKFSNKNNFESLEFYNKLARKMIWKYSPNKLRIQLSKNEDAISEVLYSLVVADDTYDPTKNIPLDAWRNLKSKYCIMDYVKNLYREQWTQIHDSIPSKYSGTLSALIEGSNEHLTVDDIDNKEIFEKCQFSKTELEVMRLKLIEQKSYRQIGKILNKSHEWVGKTLKKSAKKYYELCQ